MDLPRIWWVLCCLVTWVPPCDLCTPGVLNSMCWPEHPCSPSPPVSMQGRLTLTSQAWVWVQCVSALEYRARTLMGTKFTHLQELVLWWDFGGGHVRLLGDGLSICCIYDLRAHTLHPVTWGWWIQFHQILLFEMEDPEMVLVSCRVCKPLTSHDSDSCRGT